MGMFFNSFFRHANIVKMANLAQLVNGIAPIFTNDKGLFLQPIYFPIAEFGKQRGNTSLDLFVSSPTYAVGKRPPLNYLDTSSTYNKQARAVYLNVLNRSAKLDITAFIENQSGRLGESAEVWQMNHADLKAAHTFGDDRKVRPVTKTVPLAIDKDGFVYTFPAHSLTILRLQLQ
jgi:alpha-N-arabinofuranosidase